MYDEIHQTLNQYVGSDVDGLVMSFLFDKCCRCNQWTCDDDGLRLYDETILCISCSETNDFNICSNKWCAGLYLTDIKVKCNICNDVCKYYCPKCLYKENIVDEDDFLSLFNDDD